MKVWNNMQAAGEAQSFRLTQLHNARGDALMHECIWLSTGSVPADDVVKKCPGSGLPTLVEPAVGKHDAKIRPPHSGRWPRFRGKRHHTA